MQTHRPIYLDMLKFNWPLPSIVSGMHRISGFLFFIGMPVLLYLLQQSLASEETFLKVQTYLQNPFFKIGLWMIMSILSYHVVAGIRHLLMDFHIGESFEGGRRGSYLVLAVVAIVVILLAVWIF